MLTLITFDMQRERAASHSDEWEPALLLLLFLLTDILEFTGRS